MNSTKNQNHEVAEIEITYRSNVKPSDRIKVNRSQDCYLLLRDLFGNKIEIYEQFYILLLNRANRILGFVKISEGGVSGTVVDPKKIFQIALKANASGIILAHNHPSGNIQPSASDEAITAKIVAAGKFLEISVLDHLVITNECYFSFSDEGRL